MREIKFKARSIADDHKGKWIYGFYEHYAGDWIWDKGDEWEVDGETVGQFTGLKDKNGKEIYEGDILAMPEISKEVYWIVGWKAMRGFMHDGEDMPVGFTITSNIPQHIHPDVINLEIIGNIHENKEKLIDSKK